MRPCSICSEEEVLYVRQRDWDAPAWDYTATCCVDCMENKVKVDGEPCADDEVTVDVIDLWAELPASHAPAPSAELERGGDSPGGVVV